MLLSILRSHINKKKLKKEKKIEKIKKCWKNIYIYTRMPRKLPKTS